MELQGSHHPCLPSTGVVNMTHKPGVFFFSFLSKSAAMISAFLTELLPAGDRRKSTGMVERHSDPQMTELGYLNSKAARPMSKSVHDAGTSVCPVLMEQNEYFCTSPAILLGKLPLAVSA